MEILKEVKKKRKTKKNVVHNKDHAQKIHTANSDDSWRDRQWTGEKVRRKKKVIRKLKINELPLLPIFGADHTRLTSGPLPAGLPLLWLWFDLHHRHDKSLFGRLMRVCSGLHTAKKGSRKWRNWKRKRERKKKSNIKISILQTASPKFVRSVRKVRRAWWRG